MSLKKVNSTSFKKGHKPWHAGKPLPDYYKKSLSEARKRSKHRTGRLHPRWLGGKDGYYHKIAKTKKIIILITWLHYAMDAILRFIGKMITSIEKELVMKGVGGRVMKLYEEANYGK